MLALSGGISRDAALMEVPVVAVGIAFLELLLLRRLSRLFVRVLLTPSMPPVLEILVRLVLLFPCVLVISIDR